MYNLQGRGAMKPLLAEYAMHLSEGPTAPATAAPHTLGISSGSTVWAASVGESRGRPGFSQHLPIVVCCASGFECGSELPSLLLFLPLQTVTLSHTGTPHTQRFQVGISPTLPSGQLNLKSSLLLNILLVHLLPALPGLWLRSPSFLKFMHLINKWGIPCPL